MLYSAQRRTSDRREENLAGRTVGISISASDAQSAVDQVVRAEELGVAAAWMTSGGGGGDSLTVLAAAAARTERIKLGTSIVQTWSRHPVTVAQQSQAIAALAPGRFRLGVGPGHRQGMERTFGADFRAPLGHLSEYLKVLKGVLQDGAIDLDGRYYSAHAEAAQAPGIPVMASALRPKSFALCGAEADGAISWVCPLPYVRDTALPALKDGAREAGRSTPPLIVHAAVCVEEDLDAVREGVRQRLGYFPRTPFYARMFEAAGFLGSMDSGWTDNMLDTVVISGDEALVAERLEEIFAWGASEVLATIVPIDNNPGATERTMRLFAQVSGS